MAHVYIHIPFCRKACTYCDFHFSTSLKRKAEIVEAICQEVRLQRTFFGASPPPLQTLYFGGGTPSVLSESELAYILETVRLHFPWSPDIELTLEANPDDLSLPKLESLHRLGINRLSIGIQSFRAVDLQWMNRSHTPLQALEAIQHAQQIGIHNISADLIFGLPNSTMDDWQRQLEQAIECHIPHLSLYALTVEERTALAHQVAKGKVYLPQDQSYVQQFLFAHSFLSAAGYDHYELSNYALPNAYSRHNRSYWLQRPYLGIGPSAHSFNGQQRFWNVSNNVQYIRALQSPKPHIPAEVETLSLRDQYNEYIMTHLRKREGIDAEYIRKRFAYDIERLYPALLSQWIREGILTQEASQYKMTPEGWMLSDAIISELFWVDD